MPAPQIAVVAGAAPDRAEFSTPQLTAAQMRQAAQAIYDSAPGFRFEDCLRTVQARARRIEANTPKAAGYRAWFESVGIKLT